MPGKKIKQVVSDWEMKQIGKINDKREDSNSGVVEKKNTVEQTKSKMPSVPYEDIYSVLNEVDDMKLAMLSSFTEAVSDRVNSFREGGLYE